MNILLAGVGGQGTVLASKILAQCAMDRGERAHTAETIGMAQRGGSVVSHVRIGAAYSPLIPKGTADALIGFEPAEAARCIAYLKPGGVVIVSDRAIQPTTSSLSGVTYSAGAAIDFLKASAARVYVVDAEAICRECGSYRALNLALLGAAAASGAIGVTADEIAAALPKLVAARHIETNLVALRLGAERV